MKAESRAIVRMATIGSTIYSTFKTHPGRLYRLLGLALVAWSLGLALSASEVFPDRYDWVLGCLLFAVTAVWATVAALAGATAPVGNDMMESIYGFLKVLLLAFGAYVIALVILPESALEWLSPARPIVVLPLLAWMALAGLAGSVAPRDINVRKYITLVIAPLLMGIAFMASFGTGYFFEAQGWDWAGGLPFVGALLAGYGLVVFLLSRALLAKPKWTHRFLRSNRLFITVVAFTVLLVTLKVGLALTATVVLRPAVLYGLATILLVFGMILLWDMRTGRSLRVAVSALGISMASYWVLPLVLVPVVLLSSFPVLLGPLSVPVIIGIAISVPAGYLITKVRHPQRNVLVAAIGPGLFMMMATFFYWFVVLDSRA